MLQWPYVYRISFYQVLGSLTEKSHEISKPWSISLELADHSEIGRCLSNSDAGMAVKFWNDATILIPNLMISSLGEIFWYNAIPLSE